MATTCKDVRLICLGSQSSIISSELVRQRVVLHIPFANHVLGNFHFCHLSAALQTRSPGTFGRVAAHAEREVAGV